MKKTTKGFARTASDLKNMAPVREIPIRTPADRVFTQNVKDRSTITLDRFPHNVRGGQTKMIIKPVKGK